MAVARPTRRHRALRELATVAAAAAVVLVGRSSFADHYQVPSGSMLPTVHIGDHIVVDKAAYGLRLPLTEHYLFRWSGPARGDVVVLHSPENGIVLLKRIVAVPGDRVVVQDGKLELNGARVPVEVRGDELVEDLGASAHPLALHGGGPDFGPVVVPGDKYLVLGDNRGESNDGRSFGFVDRNAILGRALRVVFRDGEPSWTPL